MVTKYVSPVSGTWAVRSSNRFKAPRGGGSRNHSGNDLQAKNGSPAVAAIGGKIIYAKKNRGYGWNAVVLGDDGNAFRYATHGPLAVKYGDRVEQGQKIGTIGRGHLHFEAIPAGSPIIKKQLNAGNKFVPTQWWPGKAAPTIDPASLFGVSDGTEIAAGEPVGDVSRMAYVTEDAPQDPFGVHKLKGELPLLTSSAVPTASLQAAAIRQDSPEHLDETSPTQTILDRQAAAAPLDPQQVADVQEILADQGYDVGPIDGIVGRQTLAAVDAFREANNIGGEGVNRGLARSIVDATAPSVTPTEPMNRPEDYIRDAAAGREALPQQRPAGGAMNPPVPRNDPRRPELRDGPMPIPEPSPMRPSRMPPRPRLDPRREPFPGGMEPPELFPGVLPPLDHRQRTQPPARYFEGPIPRQRPPRAVVGPTPFGPPAPPPTPPLAGNSLTAADREFSERIAGNLPPVAKPIPPVQGSAPDELYAGFTPPPAQPLPPPTIPGAPPSTGNVELPLSIPPVPDTFVDGADMMPASIPRSRGEQLGMVDRMRFARELERQAAGASQAAQQPRPVASSIPTGDEMSGARLADALARVGQRVRTPTTTEAPNPNLPMLPGADILPGWQPAPQPEPSFWDAPIAGISEGVGQVGDAALGALDYSVQNVVAPAGDAVRGWLGLDEPVVAAPPISPGIRDPFGNYDPNKFQDRHPAYGDEINGGGGVDRLGGQAGTDRLGDGIGATVTAPISLGPGQTGRDAFNPYDTPSLVAELEKADRPQTVETAPIVNTAQQGYENRGGRQYAIVRRTPRILGSAVFGLPGAIAGSIFSRAVNGSSIPPTPFSTPNGYAGMINSISGPGPFSSPGGASSYLSQQNWNSPSPPSPSGGASHPYFTDYQTDPRNPTGGYVTSDGTVHTYDI